MRFSPRTWALLSVMLFVAAAFFWLKGNEYEARRPAAPAAIVTNKAKIALLSTSNSAGKLATLGGAPAGTARDTLQGADPTDKMHPFRLRNTPKHLKELIRDDHGLLLANALIDTASGEKLNIPAHLKAKEEPGSYIVQSRGAPDAAFRSQITKASAEIVSYVPNNAYLVRASAEQAIALEQADGIQSVLPFEPYYKLHQKLLPMAVKQEDLEPNVWLRLTLLPGARDEAFQAVRGLNAQVMAEERSPFGPQLIIQPAPGSLAELAQLPCVQGIEPDLARIPASDLSRVVMGVAPNGSTNKNYLDLTGTNIWLSFNDIEVDTNHVSLKDRVYVGHPSMATDDPNGHGTFVANLLVGDGTDSDKIAGKVQGSETNPPASFRGMAPQAKLFGLPLDSGTDVYPKVSDSFLQETAARTNYITLGRTNTLISNNSWTYDSGDYDSAAARYDEAVRDSIPGKSGSQPVLFVFAAGNAGGGDDNGFGGNPDSILSPGTAKNVITVGALENLRFITNSYTNSITVTNVESDGTTTTTNVTTQIVTNYPFFSSTDSANQVASFSGRGNVGVGLESDFGRFKPDVVAPGTFLVSARSKAWNIKDVIDTNSEPGITYAKLQSGLGQYRYDSGSTYAAANVSGMLALLQEYYETQAPTPLVTDSLSPALMKALLINGSRSLTELYDLSPQKVFNYQGWGLPNLPTTFPSFSTNKHADIVDKKWRLRYIDQNPTNALATGQSRTWKVSMSDIASSFPLRVTLVWTDPPGNPNVATKLVNDLDLIVTNTDSGMVFYGNNFPNGSDYTDGILPPQDPGALFIPPFDAVNNVENVFIASPGDLGTNYTITVRARRVNVNSVTGFFDATKENNDVVQDFALVISSDLGTDLTFNSDDLDLREEDSFETFDTPAKTEATGYRDLLKEAGKDFPRKLTNGLPALDERIGANPALVGGSGITNQWNFYVFHNESVTNDDVTATAGKYVAFVTFSPPNLAVPRTVEADIDIYVSKDPKLLDLDPTVLASSLKSLDRGGTELITLDDAAIGDDFYIAIKSEDQQAAEYSLIAVSSDQPFESVIGNHVTLQGIPLTSRVPDGTARRPGADTVMAIGLNSHRVLKTRVTDTIAHQDLGDLVGILTHQKQRVVLNNHNLNNGKFTGTNTFVYDDSTRRQFLNSIHTDGPGSLTNFVNTKVVGPWILNMIDNAPSHTGRVQRLTIDLDTLQKPLIAGQEVHGTLVGQEDLVYPIDVPAGVTNTIVRLRNVTPAGSKIEGYLRRGDIPETPDPTNNTFVADFVATNNLGTGFQFSYGDTGADWEGNIFTKHQKTIADPAPGSGLPLPPMGAGTWYLAIHNPDLNQTFPIDFDLLILYEFDINANNTTTLAPMEPRPIPIPLPSPDDAMTNSLLETSSRRLVGLDKLVTSASVLVRMDHPREADTILRLTTPQGTRLILSENRGVTDANGFGSTYYITNKVGSPPADQITTNYSYLKFTEDTNLAQLPIKLLSPPFADLSPDRGKLMTNGFETAPPGNYPSGNVVDGWTVDNGVLSISDYSKFTVPEGKQFAVITDAAIRRKLPTKQGRSYLLSFACRAGQVIDLFNTGLDDKHQPILVDPTKPQNDPHWFVSHATDPRIGPRPFVSAPPANGYVNTLFSEWLAPTTATQPPFGDYTYRTYFTIPQGSIASATVSGRFWADQRVLDVNLNGKPLVPQPGGGGPGANQFAALQINPGGGLETGVNFIDFIINDPPALFRAELALTANGAGQPTDRSTGQVILGDSALGSPTTNTIVGASAWKVFQAEFVATADNMPLIFQGNSPGLWIDNVQLLDTGTVYALPEEPLDVINGESTLGEWSLEIVDARTGAISPASQLLDWKLELTMADPDVLTEPLQEGTTYPIPSTLTKQKFVQPGVIYTNQVEYFEVPTCPDTTKATITLVGLTNVGKLELLMDRSGLPTGDPERDDYRIVSNSDDPGDGNGRVVLTLTTNTPAEAPLRPGLPFFIAVRAASIFDTNLWYTLRVDFDKRCTPPPSPLPIITSSQTIQSTLSSVPGFETEGELYSYNPPIGASAFSLQMQASGAGSILASQGAPPTRNSYTYKAEANGAPLVVSSASPETWYILVLNDSAQPITYTLLATGQSSSGATITDGIFQFSFSSAPGQSYRIDSSEDLRTWTTVKQVTATDSRTSFSAPADPAAKTRFYRVVQISGS